MPPCFHIAHLKRYVPNFSGVSQKLTWRDRFGLQLPPKWHDLNRVPPKQGIFRPFLVENQFSRLNGPLSPYTCYTYSESLACWPSNELLWTNVSASCDASEFCWQTLNPFSTKNGLKMACLGGTRFRSCHFGGSWRPNRLRQVNFWGTPEKFGT